MAKKKTTRKGVTRNQPRSKKSASSPATDILKLTEFRVLARILIALVFVVAVLWLARLPVDNQSNQTHLEQSTRTQTHSAQHYDGLSYEDFTFYAKLQDFEVKVSENNPYARTDDGYQVHYLIQAGAFADNESAEEQLVMLSLLDLDARIDQSRSMYRILIGPLDSRSAMSATREKLIDNGIEAHVMKSRRKR